MDDDDLIPPQIAGEDYRREQFEKDVEAVETLLVELKQLQLKNHFNVQLTASTLMPVLRLLLFLTHPRNTAGP
jgi:hypothetical protein